MRSILLALLALFPLSASAANVYVPASGPTIGSEIITIGGSDNSDLPGIGPTPAGYFYNVAADLADSTPGNYNNFVSILRQSGTRYAAAMTGTAVNTSNGGSVWGGQFIGVAHGNGSFAVGAQIEAESGGTGVNSQALILSVGPYSGSPAAIAGAEGSFPTTAYLSMVANPGSTAHVSPSSPYFGIYINDSNTNPLNASGSVMTATGSGRLRAAHGIDLRNATFTADAFASNGFAVDPTGNVVANNLIPSANIVLGTGQAIVAPVTGAPYISFTSVPSANRGLLASNSNGGAPSLSTTAGDLALKSATGVIQFGSSGSFSANGSVATTLGTVGPTGAHTSVQKWLKVKDETGNTLYIPAF